jgi:predicted nucleotidyltransferase
MFVATFLSLFVVPILYIVVKQLSQATPQSDVDILVQLDDSIGFFEFFQIKHYLEDLLECPVDLGTLDALKEHLKQPVLESMIHVF